MVSYIWNPTSIFHASLEMKGRMVFCFVQNFFSNNTRVRIFIFFCSTKRDFFFQNSTLGYMTKTLNQIFHWLPVEYRSQYKRILYVFKALHGLAPVYVTELVNPYVPSRSLRSQLHVASFLQIPTTRTRLCQVEYLQTKNLV
jgi:hypothetical protein